ncbi:MAG: tRNA (adenosine(37)-N6)-threonylcarbamoyltransferase complex dimerization subunit type 1 TsaB [Thomasclavelia sp.]|nr:tRNA (adenosine(37)-N6)-threonylcarbamoyltransferase complex dimerization subunit type 1 TsaB [Thomasclavelia sp.]
MKSIVIDTSNKYLIVSLYEDDKLLASYNEEGNKRQSENTIVVLNDLLNETNTKVLDYDEIIITKGPGSYTGVRVAMTIAKVIAATTNIKVKTVSSLEAYAGNDKSISIIDARSNKLYYGIYNNGILEKEEGLINIDSFEEFIKDYPGYKVVGDTNLVNVKEEKIDLGKNIYELSKTIEYEKDVDALVPHYIKDVEAKKIC